MNPFYRTPGPGGAAPWRGMIRAARSAAGLAAQGEISRVIRGVIAVGLAVVLTGCSMVGLGYPRLPDLGVLWVQRQVSLERGQADALKQDMANLLAWHRQHQLAPTADLLHRWQGMADADLSADQVCQEFDTVRGLLRDLARQAVPAMTRLGRSLNASQQQELAQSQQKSHTEFRETYLDPAPARSWLGLAQATIPTPSPGQARAATGISQAGIDKRLSQAADRYEMAYGPLTTAQHQTLQQAITQSVFDARRMLAERERRTQDLLQTLALLGPVATEAQAQALMQGWLERLLAPPSPGQQAHHQALARESCTQLARIHQLATPEQRRQAAATLGRYEAELRQLATR